MEPRDVDARFSVQRPAIIWMTRAASDVEDVARVRRVTKKELASSTLDQAQPGAEVPETAHHQGRFCHSLAHHRQLTTTKTQWSSACALE